MKSHSTFAASLSPLLSLLSPLSLAPNIVNAQRCADASQQATVECGERARYGVERRSMQQRQTAPTVSEAIRVQIALLGAARRQRHVACDADNEQHFVAASTTKQMSCFFLLLEKHTNRRKLYFQLYPANVTVHNETAHSLSVSSSSASV